MNNLKITDWCASFIRQQVKEGDLCIDATMGNGNDTLLLSSLCGETGHVLAFDIQPAALEHTRQKLIREKAPANYELLLDSHEHMNRYALPETVSCIVFNLGYLPGAGHFTATQADSTLKALDASLSLLQKGGLLSVCIYSGGDSGFTERDAVLKYLASLDYRKYLVIRSDYFNRPNHPPIPVLVIKL